MIAARFRQEPVKISLQNETEPDDWKLTDDLFDFILSAPKDSPLKFAEVEPLHSRRYPRLRCWIETGEDPTWHVWFRVPDTKTVDGARSELESLFEKNGWKVL